MGQFFYYLSHAVLINFDAQFFTSLSLISLTFINNRLFFIIKLKFMFNFISPKHMNRLKHALDFILNPSSDSYRVKQAQEILNSLRQLPEYPEILAEELSQTTNINKGLFLLLQLKKQGQLLADNVWWHLARYYYNCNKKGASLIMEILLSHGHFQKCCFSQFLGQLSTEEGWGYQQIDRFIMLVHNLCNKLEKQNLKELFCLKEFDELDKETFRALENSYFGPIIEERLVIEIIRISLMKKQHRIIKTVQNSPLTKFLINLDNPHGLIRQSDFDEILKELLSKLDRFDHYQHALKLINDIYPYKIGEFWSVIMRNYRDFVSKKIQNIRNTSQLKVFLIEEDVEKQYKLLTKVVNQNKQYIKFLILNEGQINAIVLLATVKVPIDGIEEALISILQCQTFFKNIYLLSALKYLFSSLNFINPDYYLGICQLVIQVRKRHCQLQTICDQLLQYIVPSLITCIQQDILWNFTIEYLLYLLQSELSIKTFSFLPVLQLLEHCLEYWLGNSQFCEKVFPKMSSTLLSLLNQNHNQQESEEEVAYMLIQLFNKYYRLHKNEQIQAKILIQYIDFHGLYSSHDCAQFYTIYLLRQQPSCREKFITNFMDESYWSSLNFSDIPFYTGIFIGLVENNFENEENLYQFLNTVLVKICEETKERQDNWKEKLSSLQKGLLENRQKLDPVLEKIDSMIQ